MDLHSDFSDLLVEFARCGVRYALLGGYAVGFHAKPRATTDMDLLVSGKGDNLERVARALIAFGAPPQTIDGVRQMQATEIVYLGVPPLRIDILRTADGIDTESTLGNAISVQLNGTDVSIISFDDLLANKRAAGRPQDLADVAALEKSRP